MRLCHRLEYVVHQGGQCRSKGADGMGNRSSATRINVCCFRIVLILTVFCMAVGPPVRAVQVPEYDLKVGYIFKFLSFIEFPPSTPRADNETLRLCVLDRGKLSDYFSALQGEKVDDTAITVSHRSFGSKLNDCSILFIPALAPAEDAIARTRGKSILVIGEHKNFCKQGGIISFVEIDNKLRFEINLSRATAEGFKMRSAFLKRARIVGK